MTRPGRLFLTLLALVVCGTAPFAAADTLTIVPDAKQKLLHEGDPGAVTFTVTSLYSGKVTIDSVSSAVSFVSGKDPNANGTDADEVFGDSIVLDFCSGATLLNTNTCTFRQAFLTRDLKPDNDVDTAEWIVGAVLRFHLDNNPQVNLQAGSFLVDVTDAPVPEPSTFGLSTIGVLGGVVLACVRRLRRARFIP